MSDTWEDDDKAKNLTIPGMALPGLRDLRVQFVAVIQFDLFMGPVVHINEISGGSSFIKKLKDYQTVSEVYAGLARNDVDIQRTPEDVIAIFRYDHDNSAENNPDITTILLISCIPDTKMEPIQIIGSRALSRARGDPEKIGQELSLSLREFQSSDKMFERIDSDQKIKIISDSQIMRPLELSFIKGFCMIDLEANIADFRYFPRYLEGNDLDPSKILNYLDRQYGNINHGLTTSLLFNNLPFIITRVKVQDIFFLTVVEEANLLQIQQMGDWLLLAGKKIESEWRFAIKKEVLLMLELLNKSFEMNSPPEFIENYLHTAMIADKLMPITVNLEPDKIDPPDYIASELWDLSSSFDGNESILEIAEDNSLLPFDLIRFLEWGKYRHFIEYLKK